MAGGQLTDVVQHLRRTAFLREGTAATDRQLLQDFLLRRDEIAFETLVRRHGPMVLSVCSRVLGSRHDAEDAFQATFLVLVRKAASIKQRELLANWLYGVAYRTALEARSMARRRREKQIARPPEPAVPVVVNEDKLRPVLDQELSRLPNKYREAVVLCDLAGKTRREAARQLGLAPGTLSGRLTTARRMLARRLARRGITLSTAALAASLIPSAASAGVPPALVAATVNAAAGKAVPSGVLALTHGVLKKMILSKLKVTVATMAGLALALGLAFASVPSPNPADETPRPALRSGAQQSGWREVLTMKHDHPVTLVASNPDWIAVGDETGNLFLWEAKTGTNRKLWITGGKEEDRRNPSVDRFRFSPDGSYLFAVIHNRRSLFRLDLKNTDKPPGGVMGQEPTYLGISPDGDTQLKTYGRILDIRQNILSKGNTVEYEAIRYETAVIQAVIAADNKRVASVTKDGILHLHEREALGSFRETHTIGLAERDIMGLACSADGGCVAVVGNSGFAKMYNTTTGKEIADLKGHREGGILFAVAFSPDGKHIATGSDDNTARLWDPETGKQLAVLRGHNDSVRSVAFDPTGETLFTGSADKTVKSWRMSK